MALIYPKSNSGYGDLVGDLAALGGVEGRDFVYAHDYVQNVVAEASEEMYEAWRTSTPLLSETEAEADRNAAAARAAGTGEHDREAGADSSGEKSGDGQKSTAVKKPARTGK